MTLVWMVLGFAAMVTAVFGLLVILADVIGRWIGGEFKDG